MLGPLQTQSSGSQNPCPGSDSALTQVARSRELKQGKRLEVNKRTLLMYDEKEDNELHIKGVEGRKDWGDGSGYSLSMLSAQA